MSPQLPALPSDSDSMILTARLELEPMRRIHAADLFPVLSDPRLYEFTGGAPPSSAESLSEIYARRESRRSPDGTEIWLNWLIRQRELREVIGYTQATLLPDCADVAWVVGTRWQGRGYASEAAAHLVSWLKDLGVPAIQACVNPAHMASRKVALNAGLRLTNEVRDGEEVWVLRWSEGSTMRRETG